MCHGIYDVTNMIAATSQEPQPIKAKWMKIRVV